jgi:hypothetical protein
MLPCHQHHTMLECYSSCVMQRPQTSILASQLAPAMCTPHVCMRTLYTLSLLAHGSGWVSDTESCASSLLMVGSDSSMMPSTLSYAVKPCNTVCGYLQDYSVWYSDRYWSNQLTFNRCRQLPRISYSLHCTRSVHTSKNCNCI